MTQKILDIDLVSTLHVLNNAVLNIFVCKFLSAL